MAICSPNIWQHPSTYEVETLAFDRAGLIEAHMRATRDWVGDTFLDIGCGSGFHLPRWAERAGRVIGVEPHPPLVALSTRRTRRDHRIEVRLGVAESLPVATSSVEVAQARWAYFFGPGCEPGLRELERVMKPGGAAFVIDNDATTSTFGSWFARGLPGYDAAGIEKFWARNGWQRTSITTSLEFTTRADFEAVVDIEFDRDNAAAIKTQHLGMSVDYAVNVWTKPY